MSGIAGSFGFGADTEGIARRMSGALAHRGPDGEHLLVADHAGLVHRLLDVPDRESGLQPMTSEDGRYTLVHDGALHNHAELRAELEGQGHRFRTATDTEVLLAAHAAWGTAAYDRLEGRFALALHDARTGTLTLARDHFGIAPLYYWIDQGADAAELPRLLFGSEIRALLAAERFEPVADDRAIYRYLKLHLQDDEPGTFFAGVRRLLPGQLLEIGPGGLELSAFSRLPEELEGIAAGPRRPYDQQAVAEFRGLFAEAVRRHLPGDGPVGTSLSGELGAAAVAAESAHQQRLQAGDESAGGPRQHAFAAPQSARAQRGLEALARHYPGQVAAHSVRPDPAAVLQDLRDVVRTQEEPPASIAAWADHAVMRAARDQVDVVLAGAGATEMLAASPAHAAVLRRQLRTQKRFRELAGALATARPRRGERPAVASVPIEALLNSAFVAAHSAERDSTVRDDLTARRLQDLFHTALPAQLHGQDRNAARFGLEARAPFLDRQLLRFLVSLEDSALFSGGRDQRILREALDGVLPEPPAAHRAAGDPSAMEDQWLLPIAAQVREIFASDSFAQRKHVDAPTVVALLDDFIAHPERHRTDMFWRLLSLELWMRTFLDDPAGAARPLDDQAAAAEQTALSAPTAAAPAAAPELEEPKSDYVANPGKQLDLLSAADGHTWRRLPLQTELVARGDDIEALVRERVERFAADLPADAVPAGAPWYLVISEKIVAITQGRSWFTWEVAPRPAARVLSRFVTRTPAGIGLGDPTTMELAIREVGLPRVLAASVAGAAGKLVRKRGLFYEVVGANVRAIDGPTPYSAFPSNVSAKLPPKDPDAVSAQITAALRGADLPPGLRESFVGTVVMDANDIGRNVLGSDVDTSAARLEATFADNPLGQGRQRTPLAILVDLGPAAQR